MDPNSSQQPDGNQSYGVNPSSYQGPWNPYMFGYQGAPTPWFPHGFMHPPPNAPIMHPPPNAEDVSHPPHTGQISQVDNLGEEADPSAPDVEEIEGITGRRKREGSRTKLGNFAPEEDVRIVKSWLEISCDPIINTGQKKDNFWRRVLSRYNERRGMYPERSLRSVQTRWEKIKQESGKFAGYLADSIRDNASGTSDADKTTQAAATYAGVHGHNFQFMHCWELLKDEPKWQDLKQKGGRDAGFGDHIPEGSNTIDLDSDEPAPAAASGKRPMGRDAAKASRKKNGSSGSTSSSKYASQMWDLSMQNMTIWQEENSKKGDRFDHLATIEEKRFDELRDHNKSILQLEQAKIWIMRDKLDMQMREKEKEREEREKLEDERILKIDLDSCTPELRVYYQALREEIMEKVAARRMRNQRQ